MLEKQRSLSIEREDYVRNSSFLSRDIDKVDVSVKVVSPPKVMSPPMKVVLPNVLPKVMSPPAKVVSPPAKVVPAAAPVKVSPPKKQPPPPKRESSTITAPKKEVLFPPATKASPPECLATKAPPECKDENSVAVRASRIEAATASPPKKEVTSPPVSMFKINRSNSKAEEPVKTIKRENSKDAPLKTEKLSLVDDKPQKTVEEPKPKDDESNGVGDKIKKFEKAAEDASATLGRVTRAGSVRRARTERLGSDSKEDFPPPATPFKDNVHFELCPDPIERQTKNSSNVAKWQKTDDEKIQKPEPQKIIKPEFKPMASPADVTIRSPSLGTKLPEQFSSHGTAFRNVASPDQARQNPHKFNEEVNTQNNLKPCKLKAKKEYSVSKGSSYFTRGSEEIWLVKKKDIEEIEERVLDSFRRAGGNICMRSESMRPSSDSGQSVSFTHATMGRNKRQMYARSESLDPQWAGARSQTLKRQTSVACTCGHDKKTRAKSAGAETSRPRSRSHGDDNQAHVLDKYETLV